MRTISRDFVIYFRALCIVYVQTLDDSVVVAASKQKTGWVSDTKLTTTTFDDLFEEEHNRPESQTQHRHMKKDGPTDITRAWSKGVSLEVGLYFITSFRE